MSVDTARMLELVARAKACVEDVVIPEAFQSDAGGLLFGAEEALDELETLLREAHFAPVYAATGART